MSGYLQAARFRWRRLDRVPRAMIAHWALGMGVGAVCAFLILALDFAGLRTLLWHSDIAVVGTLMLTASLAFTFGGLVAAGAAMQMGSVDEDAPRGGRRARRPNGLIAARLLRIRGI